MTHSYLDSYSHDLRKRMQSIRNDLPDDVQQARDEVNNLVDWKYYVRSYPQFVLPAVAVAAYALVPNASQPKSSTSNFLNGAKQREEEEHDEEMQQTTLWAGLTSAALTLATRSAISMATKYGSQYLAEKFSADSSFFGSREQEAADETAAAPPTEPASWQGTAK